MENSVEKSHSFSYDSFTDRLMICSAKCGEKVQGSVKILNIILDFLPSGKIANIEILNASEYLDSLGINPKILDTLEKVRLVSKQYRDGLMIYFVLRSHEGLTERVPFNLPMANC